MNADRDERRPGDQTQARLLRLFLPAERDVFRCVAALVPSNIHWSRDGESVEVIATGNSIAERRGAAGGLAVYNVFPSVGTFGVGDFRKK